jgi:hypothetical protein
MLISNILKTTAATESPVARPKGGRNFKPLSEAYKKRKRAEGAGTKANLRLKQELLNDIVAQNMESKVVLKITNTKSKLKSDNHNNGVTLPARPFLPTREGQGFRSDIMQKLNQLVRNFKSAAKRGEIQ